MIVIRLKGGLGNQMFQFAFGRKLAIMTGKELILDCSELEASYRNDEETSRSYELDIFDVKIKVQNQAVLVSSIIDSAHSRFKRLLSCLPGIKKDLLVNDSTELNVIRWNNTARILVDGYFQSENYFSSIASMIRQDFQAKEFSDEQNIQLGKRINATNAVAVHVRRGDYISNPGASAHHNLLDNEYYSDAMKIINGKIKDPFYYVFSDDPEWCREQFKAVKNIEVVELNQMANRHYDLFHMMHCKDHIIANSSFSWWGAWLAEHPEQIVIAPLHWFKQESAGNLKIIPERWIRI